MTGNHRDLEQALRDTLADQVTTHFPEGSRPPGMTRVSSPSHRRPFVPKILAAAVVVALLIGVGWIINDVRRDSVTVDMATPALPEEPVYVTGWLVTCPGDAGRTTQLVEWHQTRTDPVAYCTEQNLMAGLTRDDAAVTVTNDVVTVAKKPSQGSAPHELRPGAELTTADAEVVFATNATTMTKPCGDPATVEGTTRTWLEKVGATGWNITTAGSGECMAGRAEPHHKTIVLQRFSRTTPPQWANWAPDNGSTSQKVHNSVDALRTQINAGACWTANDLRNQLQRRTSAQKVPTKIYSTVILPQESACARVYLRQAENVEVAIFGLQSR